MFINFYAADVPTKPGKPQLKDWDKDFVELAWAPPESDGGAPVQKYVVQMRDKDERNWVDVLTVPGDRYINKIHVFRSILN